MGDEPLWRFYMDDNGTEVVSSATTWKRAIRFAKDLEDVGMTVLRMVCESDGRVLGAVEVQIAMSKVKRPGRKPRE